MVPAREPVFVGGRGQGQPGEAAPTEHTEDEITGPAFEGNIGGNGFGYVALDGGGVFIEDDIEAEEQVVGIAVSFDEVTEATGHVTRSLGVKAFGHEVDQTGDEQEGVVGAGFGVEAH